MLNGYVTNPNPNPTLTPNRNPNSNPNRINKKIQKETTLENRYIYIYIGRFDGWKKMLTIGNRHGSCGGSYNPANATCITIANCNQNDKR